MCRNGGMSLLVSSIFLNIMEIVSSNNYRIFHLSGHAQALDYSASDRYIAREWAFLIHISSLDRFLGSLEAEADALIVANALLGLLGQELFGVLEYGLLLLE